jgi:hypothetical protein
MELYIIGIHNKHYLGIVQAKAHRQVAEVVLLVLRSSVLVQQLEHLEDKTR